VNSIRLILVRHGNTFESGQTPMQVGARTDLPLTEEGRNQALYFARYLASEKIQPQAIYAGKLKRQIETAQITAQHLQVENKIQLDAPALTEIDYGLWEGCTADEIQKRWPHEYRAWTTGSHWPEIFGSTREGHIRDLKKWLQQLRESHLPGETVVAVTSNGILRLFYSLQERDGIEELKVKTGHFCELLLGNDSVQIQKWNQDPR
jgi:probable phosphoglycerate mutase